MKFSSPLFPILALFLLFIPISASAALMPPCISSGDCNLCDALHLISNLARWILGIVGASALLFFIYGGFLWITSAGVPARVQQGQKIMVNTVIGILIVVLAWTTINFIISSFVETGEAETKFKFVGKSDAEWYQLCEGKDECKFKSIGAPCDNRNGYCDKNNKCVSGTTACAWLEKNNPDSYSGWSCNSPKACILPNYDACDSAPNCQRNLCPGGAEQVCCKP